jgi:hypothetical protein
MLVQSPGLGKPHQDTGEDDAGASDGGLEDHHRPRNLLTLIGFDETHRFGLSPSGRRQPRRCERHRIVRDQQPTLGGRVGTSSPEVGLPPVTDLGCLRQIVQRQLPADPAAPLVDDGLQQPSADRLRRLLAWTFPNDPGPFGARP